MVKITKEVGYPEGGKKYKGPSENVGQDPRANIVTNAFVPGQKIDKGTKVTVQGTGAMLKSKNKTATWF
jgi:hypothetical protein|tara:strand:- start:44 stop:250 length:207 start_codon:yes stop_codon:yes gene_type:complete